VQSGASIGYIIAGIAVALLILAVIFYFVARPLWRMLIGLCKKNKDEVTEGAYYKFEDSTSKRDALKAKYKIND